jgi:hypothetical protein
MPETISLRLTAIQTALIWPGLDYLVKADKARRECKSGYRGYPFQLYPPSPAFDRGTYHTNMMEQILCLWDQLQPQSASGRRMHLNAIQIRAAIFAVRINLARMRWLRYEAKKRKRKTGQALGLNLGERSLAVAKRRSKRTISILERHMKRANRLLRSMVTPDEYRALMSVWEQHLRWMRLHLAYFQPWPSVLPGRKTRQQQDLDELVMLAKRGIHDAGFKPPGDAELRRIMRLYVRSARRGLEGKWSVPYLLANRTKFETKWVLSQFVLHRLTLERLR